ncbi:MAG: ECF transporter S component [Clostridia bacterium]|nr:ECF transporter S component [Clostridia bacterium]
MKREAETNIETKASAKNRFDTKKITMLGMFVALSFAVTYLSHLTPAVFLPYLHLDFKDALIVVCGFILGPLEALIVAVASSLLELTISSTGLIGLLMNVISSCSFAVTAVLIYRRNRTMAMAIGSLVCGIVVQVGVMVFWNYIITPLYMPTITREDVLPLLLPAIIPFNAIKGFLNMALTLLIYSPIKKALVKTKLIPEPQAASSIRFECIFFSGLIIVTCVLILLIQNHII